LKGLENMKKIISMSLALMMIVMMVGCASKETTKVVPSIDTDTTAVMVQKCDEVLEEIYGNRVLTEVVDGRYQVIIAEPGLTTEVIYLSGLSKSYDDLSVACKEAVGMDAVVGVCDTTGTLIYVSLNGVDVTGSIQ
jgi:peroxiredoxin